MGEGLQRVDSAREVPAARTGRGDAPPSRRPARLACGRDLNTSADRIGNHHPPTPRQACHAESGTPSEAGLRGGPVTFCALWLAPLELAVPPPLPQPGIPCVLSTGRGRAGEPGSVGRPLPESQGPGLPGSTPRPTPLERAGEPRSGTGVLEQGLKGKARDPVDADTGHQRTPEPGAPPGANLGEASRGWGWGRRATGAEARVRAQGRTAFEISWPSRPQ